MSGGGNGKGSVSECFWLGGQTQGEGPPRRGGIAHPRSVRGSRGAPHSSPAAAFPPGLALGQERARDWPSSHHPLPEVTSTPIPRVTSQPTKQEGMWAEMSFFKLDFHVRCQPGVTSAENSKYKAAKWHSVSSDPSCATPGPEELESHLLCEPRGCLGRPAVGASPGFRFSPSGSSSRSWQQEGCTMEDRHIQNQP